jgi:hypothetical protein
MSKGIPSTSRREKPPALRNEVVGCHDCTPHAIIPASRATGHSQASSAGFAMNSGLPRNATLGDDTCQAARPRTRNVTNAGQERSAISSRPAVITFRPVG